MNWLLLLLFLFLFIIYWVKKSKNKENPPSKSDITLFTADNFLKQKGDAYEKKIGASFEKKGFLVIYNGFIHGYKDGGIDIIAIDPINKTINLVQCKNWDKKIFEVEHLLTIYNKLNTFRKDDYLTVSVNHIKQHLQHPYHQNIKKALNDIRLNFEQYTCYKKLYLANERTIDLAVSEHLTTSKDKKFRYKDMKIVIHKVE
jgi:hypothetical protein